MKFVLDRGKLEKKDLRMSGRLPCVQYVTVAVEVSVTGAVFESTALLQPADTAVALDEPAR